MQTSAPQPLSPVVEREEEEEERGGASRMGGEGVRVDASRTDHLPADNGRGREVSVYM